MDSFQKDLLTANTVLLVKAVDFETISKQLLTQDVLSLQILSNIMSTGRTNTERIQLMLVELKKSANPAAFQNFISALSKSGYGAIVQQIVPNFYDGRSFGTAAPESNNNNGQGFFANNLSQLIQPAVFHHVQPVANPTANHTSPNSTQSMESLPSLNDLSSNSAMDVEMEESSSGTIGEYDVVKEVTIKQSTMLYNSCEYYKMTSNPKGDCLIINNVDFCGGPTGHELMPTREGSDRDATLLHSLFTQLGYSVEIYKNLPAKVRKKGDVSMEAVLTDFAKDEKHKNVDSAVIIILSHGNEDDLIYGIDAETISMKSILKFFNNENCPVLKKKPKLFFVQACRGVQIDRGVTDNCVHDSLTTRGSAQPVALTRRDSMEDRIPRTSTWSDMLMAYSTCPGYVSIRNVALGSWFIQTIVQIFASHAHDTHLQDMMTKVSYNMLKNYETAYGEKQAMELVLRGWVKNLYFNPGRSE